MRLRTPAVALLFSAFACGGDNNTVVDGGDAGTQKDAKPPTDGSSTDGPTSDAPGNDATTQAIKTVFLIVMENHNWSDIKGNASAPYINGTLLKAAAHAENYKTPPGNHPSEPNYIWLEAGDNLGITDDSDPSSNHQSTKDHLVSQLQTAGITWRVYAEDIAGTDCPQADTGLFAVRHVPQVFFDDIASDVQSCKNHIRPFSELGTDLKNDTTARYNVIIPNLCDDMHGQSFGTTCNTFFADLVKFGDTFLSTTVPAITGSAAYTKGGALFIAWDEGTEGLGTASDGPIPLFVVSPFAKASYTNSIPYTHSSMLRTLETIFGVPYLLDAANATDLSDLFTAFP